MENKIPSSDSLILPGTAGNKSAVSPESARCRGCVSWAPQGSRDSFFFFQASGLRPLAHQGQLRHTLPLLCLPGARRISALVLPRHAQ